MGIKATEKPLEQLLSNLPVQVDIDYENPEEVDKFLQQAFPGVSPNPKEFYKGKLQAYTTAVERMIKEKQERERKARISSITAAPTYNEVFRKAHDMGLALGVEQGFEFVIDEENEKAFDLLCYYFANDKRFEESGHDGIPYSLNKGIWLQSSVRGTGKSVMLRCFQFNKRICFAYKHISELVAMYQKGGHDRVEYFIKTIPQPATASNFYQAEAGIMYDEMFDDSVTNYMGTPCLLSKHIITSLYDHSHNYKGAFWKFHITSNYDGNDIEQKFGKNVRSRMVEMFNLIKLEGKNRRIK